MLPKLLAFELNYHAKQLALWFGSLLLVWMAVLLTAQMGTPLDYANSAYSINKTLAYMSMYIIFVVAVLTASTVLRDSHHNMEPLIFATPVDKFQYLITRFCGVFISAAVVYLIVLVAMMITPSFMDPEQVGPFNLSHYLYSYLIFIVPNILLCTSVVFCAAMLTKNTISIYVAAILLFVIHGIGSVLGNSPIMAASSQFLHEGASFASLLDPYGGVAFFDQTSFWSSNERNTLLPSLEGHLLFNRLLWTTVGLTLFALTYKLFSFRAAKFNVEKAQDIEPIHSVQTTRLTVKHNTNFANLNWSVLRSKIKIEYTSVVKGKTFIVLMFATLVMMAVNVISNTFEGPLNNGQSYYPITELLLEVLQDPLSTIGRFVAIFYAVELYWNERTTNIAPLIDATPTRNSTFYLAKLSTLTAICFTLITACIVVAIAFQLSQGHWNIKPQLYLILYYYAGIPMVLTAVFTLFVQRFASNRAMGLALGASLFVITQVTRGLELSHPLTIFAFSPDFVFSDMANSLYHAKAVHWFNLYWVSFCAILAVFTVKNLHRGHDKSVGKLTPMGKKLLASFTILFVASGCYTYYQVNIFNLHTSRQARFDIYEDYEKRYSQYKNMPQPTVTDVTVNVDIFPEQNKYQAQGNYIIQNKSDAPIEELLIGVLKKKHLNHSVEILGAKLEKYDELHHMYFFKLDKPLLPGETTTLNFELTSIHSPFTRLDPEHYVTSGGSYVELEDVLPQFGYVYNYAITNEEERKSRQLSTTGLEQPEDLKDIMADDWIQLDITVSTSLEQTAVTPGNLEKTWIADGRRYFNYQTDQKIAWRFALTSAEFAIAKYQYKGVEILIYHAPEHDKDNQLIVDALRQNLDYFNEHFTPYTFKSFKVVELPYFSSRQSFGTAYPGMYLGVENRFFNLNNDDAVQNPQLRGVSHEFGHQYWGGYIQPYYAQGSPMVTETLAKYTEIVMANNAYGQYAINEEIGFSISRYLRMRGFGSGIEKPLYLVGMQPHVFYSKGKHSMHALRGLIGEQNINKALKQFLQDFGYPNKPTSLDLLNAFYQVSTAQQRPIIDDLFKRVVFHDFKINAAKVTPLDNGQFDITIEVTTLKSVMNQQTGKESFEIIDDTLDIGFYDGFPAVNNANMTVLKKVKFNQDHTAVTIRLDHKPAYVLIDPNRYRIDRALSDNQIAL